MIEITAEYLASQGLSKTFERRFWQRVFITPTHWLWEGPYRAPMNHGSLWRGVRNAKGNYSGLIYAHVASWILHNGPIPDGMLVLHCCPGKHIAWCVNPGHLYLGSFKDNTRDMIEQGSLYFFKGHNRSARGELNHMAKLTQAQVDEIWKRYSGVSGQLSDFAVEFGVSQAAVANLIIGKTWGRLPHPAFVARQARILAERQRTKLSMLGEGNPTHKLSTCQVDEIRQKYTGAYGQQRQLAREYGCTQGNIWYIVNHKTRVSG